MGFVEEVLAFFKARSDVVLVFVGIHIVFCVPEGVQLTSYLCS